MLKEGGSFNSSSYSSSKVVACSCDVPSPIAWRGAALARARSPRGFGLDADTAETRENRRLPRTSQGDAFTLGFRFPYTQNVSRITILSAFQQLHAEGYAEGSVGSGTYVAKSIPDHAVKLTLGDALRRLPSDSQHGPRKVSKLGTKFLSAPVIRRGFRAVTASSSSSRI